MQGAGSIYFATLQGYVINETELYMSSWIFFFAVKYIFDFANKIALFGFVKTMHRLDFQLRK